MRSEDPRIQSSQLVQRLLVCAVLVLAGRTQAAMPDLFPKDCPRPKTPAQALQDYARIAEKKFDVQQLTCAATLIAKVADQKPADLELNATALGAQMELLELLSSIQDEQLYQVGETYADLKRRWQLGLSQGKKLSNRLRKYANDPLIGTLLVAYQLSATAKLVDAQTQLEAAISGVKTLSGLVSRKDVEPNDLALVILGRLTLSLPAVYGGDVEESIRYLKAAYDINSQNISTLRWTAEAMIANNQTEQSKRYLREILKLDPQTPEVQQYVDDLKAARGLASRIGDEALSQRLNDMRERLIKQNPGVRTRASVATLGHGGVDPMTGKSTD